MESSSAICQTTGERLRITSFPVSQPPQGYEADLQRLQQQQREAEDYLGRLQEQAQQDAYDQSVALQDSLNNFIAEYIKTHPYDAILYKAAGAYFNPELDITKEVVEGLNARYKKVETKEEK